MGRRSQGRRRSEDRRRPPQLPAFTNAAATGLALLAMGFMFRPMYSNEWDAKEISFQEFKTALLERGLVDRVEVSNKTQAKVYVTQAPRAPGTSPKPAGSFSREAGNGAQLRYYFNIGSLDSFERKMEEAQDDGGGPARVCPGDLP